MGPSVAPVVEPPDAPQPSRRLLPFRGVYSSLSHTKMDGMTRLCERCGVDISDHHGCARYCGAKCRNAAKYDRDKASGLYDRKKAARRELYAREKAAGLIPRDYKRQLRSQEPRPALEPRLCEECPTTFTPSTPNQRYCCPRCRRRAGRRRPGLGIQITPLILYGTVSIPNRPRFHEWLSCDLLPTGGIWVHCPRCHWMMGIRFELEPRHVRWCPACDIYADLNPEGIAALQAA